MNSKKEIDGGVIMAVVGVILIIGFLIFMFNSLGRSTMSTDSCDSDCEYYKDNQPELEPDPIDYNGDGTITRDEFEDDPIPPGTFEGND